MVELGVAGKFATGICEATGIYETFEVPPPGAGEVTVTVPSPTAATSASGTAAVNSRAFTNVVTSAAPFQCTVELDTNPAPRTVILTPVLPGVMLTGGTISTKGTDRGGKARSGHGARSQ